MLRQAGQNHRDVIAGVLAACAGNDDSGAADPAAVAWRLQRHRHLGPLGEGFGAAELYPVLVDDHRVGGKGDRGLPRLDHNL